MRRRGWFPLRLWTWFRSRLDARRNVPPVEAKVLSETEQEILNAYNKTLRHVEKEFGKKADPAEAKLNEIQKKIDELYKPEYERLAKKAGRLEPQIYISWTAHWVLLTLFALGEGAFNLVAFNVLREPGPQTIVMALTVVIGIPVGAYFMGVHLRQWPPPWWKTALLLVAVLAVVVGGLSYINDIRLAYLAEIDPEFAKANPALVRAFLAINIFVFAMAAIVSYLGHDSEPNFAETKAKLDRSNSLMSHLQGKLDRWATELETDADMLQQSGWSLMALYRNVNRRHRNGVPKYFDDDTEKNYRPEFVKIRPVDQFHGGAHRAAPSSPIAITGQQTGEAGTTQSS